MVCGALASATEGPLVPSPRSISPPVQHMRRRACSGRSPLPAAELAFPWRGPVLARVPPLLVPCCASCHFEHTFYYVSMRVEYREEPCRTAISKVEGMPFRWSLNPFTG